METPPTRSLDTLKASPKNPRKVTRKQLGMLKEALKTFGDLGGVIANRRSGHLVGGHQRIAVFKAASKEKGADVSIVLTRQLDEPTENGTVAEGYIDLEGERFSYREVDWDPNTEALANIAANKPAGSFDTAELARTLQLLSKTNLDLTLSMFDPEELRAYLPDTRILEQSSGPAALEPDDATPQRIHGATPPGDAPHADAPDEPQMKSVSLYYRPHDHGKFVELVDALKDIYHRSNTSDVVFEALKRASVQAAFK